jgi:LmbE family N-acetylglucosaminyl deacetylase
MNVLLIFAHPDDEVLGCGATIAKFAMRGAKVSTFILSDGVTSRYNSKNTASSDKEIKNRQNEMRIANKIIGVKEIFTESFPDNSFDSVPLLDIVKKIEYIKQKTKPQIIFTHHFGDMNIDHQITYQAVLTATRPMQSETVKEIYSCEIPSSTEWNFEPNRQFVPNVFFDVSKTISKKIKALAEYKSELRKYPHPRSLQHIEELAKFRGVRCGLSFAEAFCLVRSVKDNV